MDVGDCIKAYTSMFQMIFGKKGLPVNMWERSRVDLILTERGSSETEPINDGKERCKV
jgi:hypothetical protein